MGKSRFIHIIRKLSCLVTGLLLCLVAEGQERTICINIDGAIRYQKLDGFGVNINPAWWYKGEYGSAETIIPALDMLIDSLGATIFRVVIEEIDWEAVNDDNDPDHFNWDYYNSVFSNKKFCCIWNTLRYLNSRGITNNLMISFMGAGPSPAPLEGKDPAKSWMGGTDYSISQDKEDEFAESLAAFLFYLRNTAKVSFSLVSPMNETDVTSWSKKADHPDGIVEGPNIPDPAQYIRVVGKLARKLDSTGMSDIRFVAPDAAGEKLFAGVMEEMLKDNYLMGKLACWGVHQYGDDAANYLNLINRPANLSRAYWVTETAGIGNMLGQLDDDARAYIFWDGFDCVYQHGRRNGYGDVPPNDWAFWMTPEDGKPLLEYDQVTGNWRPRKQFYQHAQLMRFVKTGAVRVGLTGQDSILQSYAFINPDGQLIITGRNSAYYRITLNGKLDNIDPPGNMKMFFTGKNENMAEGKEISLSGDSFSVVIPPDCIFTITGDAGSGPVASVWNKPEPEGWYAGDMHIHRNCGEATSIIPESELTGMMEQNDLAVISVLADMGNGEVKDSKNDLPKVNGKDAPQSIPGRIVHWDAEWHFDPAGVTFENKALGGHVVLLGLDTAHQIWDESPYKIIEWGKQNHAVAGMCHMQYLNDSVQTSLDCCIPVDYPVEVALGGVDFLAEDVWLNDAAIKGYYRLLNCGFRPGWAAGTDFPCNGSLPFGSLLTYVCIDEGPLTYRKWIEGIKKGRTVVSTNGHNEFLDLKVGKNDASPGDEIKSSREIFLPVKITWTSTPVQKGRIELICNGKVISSLEGNATSGKPLTFKTNIKITESSWISARRMDDTGHRSHTSPVYVIIKNKPVRANADDARFFVAWIDNILSGIAPGGPWYKYFNHDRDIVQERYIRAKDIYARIESEALKYR
jgi:O-glycosyl hydrolase